MRRFAWLKELINQTSWYRRSFLFFLSLGSAALTLYLLLGGSLHAGGPIEGSSSGVTGGYDLDITLATNGQLYLQNSRLDAETSIDGDRYHIRYQIIDHPADFLDHFSAAIHLPFSATDQTIQHRLANNGGAQTAESQLLDSQTVVYRATSISSQAQLALELTVPKSVVRQSLLSILRQKMSQLPLAVWSLISIGLPVVTAVVLLFLLMSRSRRIPKSPLSLDQLPSKLKPAMVGILLNGQISSRDIAATLMDLARRGHLIIHQTKLTDFRFSRARSDDAMEDFEKMLLEQIFGPLGQQSDQGEISFNLEQELFSRRVSRSFILAYQKIGQLGYFYANPLLLHRRYQTLGIILFLLGLVGFFANIVLYPELRYSLVFWFAMMLSALLINQAARSLPMRSIEGDQEVGRWLSFKQWLAEPEPIGYQAHSQELYLAYLPYAIVLNVEVEWTKRFYDLPFAAPAWYISAPISTIDDFANRIFPMFGYLSQLLAASSQPAVR